MSWPVDCANCGKQILVDGPGEKCYWCGKSVDKKESIMQEHQGAVEESIPKQEPKKVRKTHRSKYAEHQEKIVADYGLMSVADLAKKHQIQRTQFYYLKRKWEAKGVVFPPRFSGEPGQRVSQIATKKGRPSKFNIVITEEDLAKLDDEQFQQIWPLLGIITQNRRTTIEI